MQVTICGKRYRLNYVRLSDKDGECDCPSSPNKQIKINREALPDDRRHMEAVLHEVLHAAVWSLDEEYVAAYAHDAARILHRLGFRYVEDVKHGSGPRPK